VKESLHEMFVIYSSETFVRPNKHVGKDESIFVMRGEADFLFFDDRGDVIKVVEMGEVASGKAYFCRVPEGIYHTIIMRSPEVVLFEATPGPFNPAETEYAHWGPQENELDAVATYREWMNCEVRKHHLDAPRALISLESLNPLVLVATDRVVPLSSVENEFLQEKRRFENLDRLRICVHKSGDDRLHEMLMTFDGNSYIRPSMHVDKEESLFFLDGLATYVFFNDSGAITSTVKLGPNGSGRDCYCRVPANTWHSLIVESRDVLVKETTSGPFRRSDTAFAEWAPDGSDPDAVNRYMTAIRTQI